jgi:ubiquinone/menaquinone biosynthesis C-methylase UbiE
VTIGQWFARIVTSIVVRVPALWRVFRRPLTANFDRLAPEWDATRVHEISLGAMRAALDGVETPPKTALDLGTGSGAVARLVAARWPDADVVGADVSSEMVNEARRLATTQKQRYDVADASRLPYDDGAFELVTMNNMIPFFDELARVTAPRGQVAVSYSRGASTPIWVPLERVQAELQRRNFTHVATFSAGPGLSLLARKGDRS